MAMLNYQNLENSSLISPFLQNIGQMTQCMQASAAATEKTNERTSLINNQTLMEANNNGHESSLNSNYNRSFTNGFFSELGSNLISGAVSAKESVTDGCTVLKGSDNVKRFSVNNLLQLAAGYAMSEEIGRGSEQRTSKYDLFEIFYPK